MKKNLRELTKDEVKTINGGMDYWYQSVTNNSFSLIIQSTHNFIAGVWNGITGQTGKWVKVGK
ncbi:MAG: hypothetical protein IJM78_05930 [Prevotella sp.]|nr:hypothetical protein [Prevotella sp.]